MAVPTSASDLFDTLLPPKIAATPDKAREINAIYQFNITGIATILVLITVATIPQKKKRLT